MSWRVAIRRRCLVLLKNRSTALRKLEAPSFGAGISGRSGQGSAGKTGRVESSRHVERIICCGAQDGSHKGPHSAWEGEYIGANAGGVWGNPTNASYAASQPIGIFVSDVRLKRDITPLGRLDDGLELYSFRYLWSDTVYVGVMAQEVAATMPSAVMMGEDGYLRVDYGKLGLRMRTLAEWEALTYGVRID